MKKRFAGILAVGLILLWAACAPAAQAPAAEFQLSVPVSNIFQIYAACNNLVHATLYDGA